MLNKKGFIFIETIIVMTVAMICLISLYSGYSLIIKNIENKKYYDNINDVYKVNIVKKMLNNNITTDNYINIASNECDLYMNNNCFEVLSNLDITNVIITSNDLTKLYKLNDKTFTNSFNRYVKTLDKDARQIIIIREKDNKRYYASLKI